MGSESFVISDLISNVYSKYPNNFAFHTKIQASDYPFIKNPIVIGNGFELDNYIRKLKSGDRFSLLLLLDMIRRKIYLIQK